MKDFDYQDSIRRMDRLTFYHKAEGFCIGGILCTVISILICLIEHV